MSLKIAIDAGHGVHTAGKRCMKKIDSNETREWTLNDRIADTVEALLKNYECDVLRTDDTTGAKDVSLANRVKSANNWKADVFISIHHNAGINGKSGGGTVIYYCSSKAERVNQAKELYNCLVDMTGLKGDRKTTTFNYGYYVIKKTTMPAFLIENGFMDSTTDVPIILTEEHATKTAEGILNFLISQFNLTKKKEVIPPSESFRVKIKVNALRYRSGAGTMYSINGLVRKGEVYTIVETKGSWGKLKSGAGWINISNSYATRL